MILMSKDKEVLKYDIDTGKFEILDNKLMPYQLKNCIIEKDDRISFIQNYNSIIRFLSSRILPLDRENAKKILNALGYEQTQEPSYKAKIAENCRAVSLQDTYWVKSDKESISWKDVDIMQNHLNKVLMQVALKGDSLTITGKCHTPELTTNGAYAKCWKRENKDLYLYKKGKNGESRIEVEVSNILDKTNVPHVKYLAVDRMTCKCKCMTTKNLSILPAMDFIGYCNRLGLNYKQEYLKIDKENLYKMFIIDYLISNSDRHGLNYGFYYDNNTMEIISFHPLFDHNNAFDRTLMQIDVDSLVYDKRMDELAKYAYQRCNFKIDVDKSDFLTESHYKSFMRKLKEIRK